MRDCSCWRAVVHHAISGLGVYPCKIKMISYFTWSEFDKSVEQIANKCRFKEFSGIYGVPRGGLCLAVALSHKLKIELISEPIKGKLKINELQQLVGGSATLP